MKWNWFLAPLLALLSTFLTAQPVIEWQRSMGGSDVDQAYSVQQTNDGGFIVGGVTSSTDGDITEVHGDGDYWVVKFSSSGQMEWQHSYGGSGYDALDEIFQTSDGGFIAAGNSSSSDGDVTMNHGGRDFWVIKLSETGSIEWERSYGGSGDDWFHSLTFTDNGYVLSGGTGSNDGDLVFGGAVSLGGYWVLELNSIGDIIWQKSYGGWNAQSVQQTSDGGFIVGGDRMVSGNVTDFWVLKLNNTGELEWDASFGYAGADQLRRVRQTQDGGYAILGYVYEGTSNGFYGVCDGWIIKLNAGGELEWDRPLGGTDADYTYDMQLTNDGGYICIGITSSLDLDCIGNEADGSLWVLKLDATGEPEWSNFMGGSAYDFGFAVQQTTDQGFIVAGDSQSSDGDHIVNQGGADLWVVKLSPENVGVTENEELVSFQIFPNPASDQITLTMENGITGSSYSIRDQMGRTVMIGSLSAHTRTLNIKDLKEGIYSIEVSSVLGRVTERFVKE
ncbi:MAG: T9SS type A sorting domain-containing protein [Flavobacteriales bacterium]